MRVRVVAAIVAPLILWACGEEKKDPTEDPTETINLDVYSWWLSGGEAEALKVVLDAHKARHPNVVMVNTAADTSNAYGHLGTAEKLEQMIADGKTPDVFQVGSSVGTWMEVGDGLEQVDELLATRNWSNRIQSSVLDTVKHEGAFYSVPVTIASVGFIYYNKQVFANAGITTLPTTMDELMEAAAKIKAIGVAPFASSKQNWILTEMWDWFKVSTGGDEFMSRLKTATLTEADKGTLRQAVEYFHRAINEFSNDDFTSGPGWDVLGKRLVDGEVAMYAHGDWVKGLLDNEGMTPGVDYDVLPPLGGGNTYTLVHDSFSFPKTNPDPKGPAAAIDFIETFLSEEVQIAFNKRKGHCPVLQTVSLDSFDPVARTVCARLSGANFTNGAVPLVTNPGSVLDAAYADPSSIDVQALADAIVDAHSNPVQ
jgi:glucose/mannose transport system substrate-binding protein